MSCKVDINQPPVSAVPGNIGTVRVKALVWDHDPFLARPHQHLTFPFSQEASEQIREKPPGLKFELGSAFLNPLNRTSNMFIATKNTVQNSVVEGLDFVGAANSSTGKEAEKYLPGGEVFEAGDKPATPDVGPSVFPHQLWIYTGSLIKNGVPIHPSEYDKDITETKASQNIIAELPANQSPTPATRFSKWTLRELQSAPKWDYSQIESDGVSSIWPKMIAKPTKGNPIHWTLQKFTNLWQGEDFTVKIRLGDKDTLDAIDDTPGSDYIDTNIDDYKYLIYNPNEPPSDDPNWTLGISNEAYFMSPVEGVPNSSDGNTIINRAIDESRKLYWWNLKTYILIELGVGDPIHNYFIELVKGRQPRLIHVGLEWDNPSRIQQGAVIDSDGFKYVKKAREISTYNGFLSDELFRRKEFGVSVRNHLGRLVITFDGFQSNPWVITRLDNDPTKFNFDKILRPMVVPSTSMRIHGGNISCLINFSPTRYTPKAKMLFKNRQGNTGPPWKKAGNDDLYMTFSSIGNSIKYESAAIHNRFFDDLRFGPGRVGYSCDAYSVSEYIKNTRKEIEIYNFYEKQYRLYGKGWLSQRPRNADGSTATVDPDVDLFQPHDLKTSLSKPHKLKINNARNEGKRFEFGLKESADIGYQYKEEVSKWDVSVDFEAGSIKYPATSDNDSKDEIIIPNAKDYIFKNCVTPIATHWSLYVLGGGKPIKDNIDKPLDISSLISHITDGWSADGFTSLNHEMKVRAYIPVGPPTGTGEGSQSGADIYEISQAFLKLHNQNFYLSISYWWDNGVGVRDAVENKLNRKGNPESSDLLIQMTGFAEGAEIEKSVNKIYMNFTVKDYMSVLQDEKIFNSPFFDGVSDTTAVLELMKLAGFDDTLAKPRGINRQPLAYLQHVINKKIDDCRDLVFNGEKSISRLYDLPGSYADLAEPAVRFQNGESYETAIKKIAQLSSKIVYFDRWGVLRFENIPAIEAAFQSGPSAQRFKPVFQFTTSPFPLKATGTESPDLKFQFDPNDPDRGSAHLVYNVVRYSRSVEDCINQIVLLTASNDIKLADGSTTGGLIVEGYTFFEQIWFPNVEGFIGYKKPFYQANGIFGGLEQIRNGLQHYAKMKYPPATVSFETYGIPGLKALDIISLDDNLFYITEITQELDSTENKLWVNISAEWFKPFDGSLSFLKERGETDSGNTGV